MGQLIGIDDAGGGIAFVDVLCTHTNYSYCQVDLFNDNIPLYSWNVHATSHEIGHNLGSPHTHDCAWNGNNTAIDGCGGSNGECSLGPIPAEGGTIMSYCHVDPVGVNLSNGFGLQPSTLILDRIAGAPCLTTDCSGCYNTVCSIHVQDITHSTAQISWADENPTVTSWQLSIQPADSPEVWIPVSSNIYNAAGLLSNTTYKAAVRQQCGGVSASMVKTFFWTGLDCNNNSIITDTGGLTGPYENGESYVRTLIPNIPGKKIKLVFTSLILEEDYDFLTLYDGNSVTAPLLGEFTGSTNPGTFESSAIDGSLTLQFSSDHSTNDDGFAATVECMDILGNDEFGVIDFTYYPNPTKGLVHIFSKAPISLMSVYDATGKLLQQHNIDDLEANADLSGYSSGVYIVRLIINNKETSFKIEKK